MIILLYAAYLICGVNCQETNETIEDRLKTTNVTKLYPVKNIISRLKENLQDNDRLITKEDIEHKNLPNKSNMTENIIITPKDNKTNELSDKDTDDMRDVIKSYKNKEVKVDKNASKEDITTWKVDSVFTASKLDMNDKYNMTKNNSCAVEKEFKPSPQLGSFRDEEDFFIPTHSTIESFKPEINTPSSIYNSYPKEFYELHYKPPINEYPEIHIPDDVPYKFEEPTYPKSQEWQYTPIAEAEPPLEIPVKIPAGGLYKHPDPFQEKPSSDGGDENFGLEFKDDEKDTKTSSVKKRVNPWKNLLGLVTALIPVGIIVSALAPRVITLENVDNNPQYWWSRLSRRSSDISDLPPVSENCKRRLLCEIHFDSNYLRSRGASVRPKHCYKIQCEDPEALRKVLSWLLLYHRNHGYRPDQYDRRGYIT